MPAVLGFFAGGGSSCDGSDIAVEDSTMGATVLGFSGDLDREQDSDTVIEYCVSVSF